MTAMSRKLVIPLLMIVVPGLIGLSACGEPTDDSVVIEYEEAAVFSEFKAPPAPGGSVPVKTVADGGLFVAYRITSIQNPAARAKDFAFDPDKLFVGTTPRAKRVGGTLASYSTVKPLVVAKGTTVSPVGRVVINVPGDPDDILNLDNDLLYESGLGEKVQFKRRPVQLTALGPATPGNLP